MLGGLGLVVALSLGGPEGDGHVREGAAAGADRAAPEEPGTELAAPRGEGTRGSEAVVDAGPAGSGAAALSSPARQPWEGQDLPPPPVPDENTEVAPPPEEHEMPLEVVLERREQGLELLASTASRLEDELAQAEADGDDRAAHRLRLRLRRTQELQERRSRELETLRSGGTVGHIDEPDAPAHLHEPEGVPLHEGHE